MFQHASKHVLVRLVNKICNFKGKTLRITSGVASDASAEPKPRLGTYNETRSVYLRLFHYICCFIPFGVPLETYLIKIPEEAKVP